MKPSQLAIQLRRIASKIEASKNPDRTLVARDLKRTLAALAAGASNGMNAHIENGKIVGIDVNVNGKTVFVHHKCDADGKPSRSENPIAFALVEAWNAVYAEQIYGSDGEPIQKSDGSYEINPDSLPYIPGSGGIPELNEMYRPSGPGESDLRSLLLASRHPKAHFEHGWKKAHPKYQAKTEEGDVIFDQDYRYIVWFLMSDCDNQDEIAALEVMSS